ncbi:MAG: inositol monophosphatase [Candidatus Omnitrophica bacterium]|nr:inositol monophosphatase [Candidatus Omnitrophota bacterium]
MDFKDVAIHAAREAGSVHEKYFQKDFSVTEKTSSFDLVTVADVEAEQTIVSLIKKQYPDHNFLCEEQKYEKTASPYTWIIDPLDGTNNFSSGLPIFCVSIALMAHDEIILGTIYDVTRDELFFAEKGKGSFLNDIPIRVNETAELQRSLLITGFYYNRGEEMIETLENIKSFFKKPILGLRRLGAAALDLCYVASGRAAGFWEFELNPWDFAAGKLIIEEAHGKITDKYGQTVDAGKKSYIVASNGKIHSQMIKILKR